MTWTVKEKLGAEGSAQIWRKLIIISVKLHFKNSTLLHLKQKQ